MMKTFLLSAAVLLVFASISALIFIYRIFAEVFGIPKEKKSIENYLFKNKAEDEILIKKLSAARTFYDRHYDEVHITSKDGLKLYARIYEGTRKDIVILLMHGYRSGGIKDFAGIAPYLTEKGFTVVMPDQRGHGKSEGRFLSFGIKERFDVAEWNNFIRSRFGNDVKTVLFGVSMGAATVLASSELMVGTNVIGIISDCSYTDPNEIILHVASAKGLSTSFFCPIIRLAAKLFGNFSLNEASPIKALKSSMFPILFIHGKSDDFVPFQMGQRLFDSYNGKKYFFAVEKATHATSYFYDPEGYRQALDEFFSSISII